MNDGALFSSSMLSDKPPELELEAADSPRAFLRKYITQEPANDLHMGIFNSGTWVCFLPFASLS